MTRRWGGDRGRQDRIKKLAERIDVLIEKDDLHQKHAEHIGGLRQAAALELYAICGRFVASINSLLEKTQLALDPASFAAANFRPVEPNLFQVNVRGRVLQIEFESPEQLVSTEHFRVPYILEGAVRSYNQQFLERESIEEQLLFCCLEKNHGAWRYFDGRTYQTGVFDEEYLIALMEKII